MDIKRVFQMIGLLIIFLFFMGFSGCATGSKDNTAQLAIPEGSSTQPGLRPEFSSPGPSEGSLWMDKNGSIFEDAVAARVGDTVVVDIVENSTSNMDVNTETSRKTSMNIGTPEINIAGATTNFGGTLGYPLIKTDFENNFNGEAESDRSGQVTASIAARVTEVLPNGNLSLFGRRAMKVDNEVQYITISGIIRPQDITANNRVKSTYLADSSIEYYGKGALADKQKPGWGTRLIDNFWPF